MSSIVNLSGGSGWKKIFLVTTVIVLPVAVGFTMLPPLLNEHPVASFTISMEAVGTYNPVTFDASDSFDTDGEIVSYLWTFGDGGTAEGMTVTHEYAVGGFDPPVTLTVVDNDGKRISVVRQMKVIKCVSCGE